MRDWEGCGFGTMGKGEARPPRYETNAWFDSCHLGPRAEPVDRHDGTGRCNPSAAIHQVIPALPEIIAAFAADLPRTLVGHFFRRRAEMARDILIDEIRHANITDAHAAFEDDAIGIIVRYLRAANEGCARLNLRLLAKAIASKLRSGQLVADEFLKCAEALAPLSRDEIIVIGMLYSVWWGSPHTSPRGAADAWDITIRGLTRDGMSVERVVAAAARAQRSGLIYGLSAPIGVLQASDLESTTVYRVSPLLIELGQSVDFEDALRREAAAEHC